LLNSCIQENVDTFVCEQTSKSVAYIWVFSGHQSRAAINNGHFAAESTHGLRKLYSYVASADNEQMFGDFA
jgi:hypothetical protein